MKVAFYTTRMLLGYGVDLALYEISRRLVRKGWYVTVFATTLDDTYRKSEFEIRKIDIYGGFLNRALPIFELNAQRALRKLKGELTQYDVHIPATFPFYGVWAVVDRPTVFFDFGNVPTKGFTIKGKANWLYMHLMETLLHSQKVHAIITISHFLARRFPLESRNKLRVVYLGGDHYLNRANNSGKNLEELRNNLRARIGVQENEVLIGTCSRLHRRHAHYKRLPRLVALFKELPKDYKAKLLVTGIGSEEDVHWLKSQGVLVLPNAPPEDMPAFYSAIDIYATMSEWEGLNLPILEASWFAKPTVALAVGAHPEIPVSSLAQNDGQFREKLLELIADGKLRDELGLKSNKLVKDFNWENTTDAFAEAINRVTSQ